MAEHIHDCIVVGAGPAGSAAALQMGREGLDVVLLERGNRPGEKNVMSCAQSARTILAPSSARPSHLCG